MVADTGRAENWRKKHGTETSRREENTAVVVDRLGTTLAVRAIGAERKRGRITLGGRRFWPFDDDEQVFKVHTKEDGPTDKSHGRTDVKTTVSGAQDRRGSGVAFSVTTPYRDRDRRRRERVRH